MVLFEYRTTLIKVYFILSLLIASITVHGQIIIEDYQRDLAFYDATNKWFTAWKLVSKEIFKIDKVKPVDFVFFDDKYIYSTSTTSMKNGSLVKGNNLMNLAFRWQKKLHNDSIILPDKSVVPINLMSFAAENSSDSSKSFFVMPLPGFWLQAGVSSKDLGLDNLITGVFIHEFSHSQQMQNFGKKITSFERETNFGVEFTDDIVQTIFSKDSIYSKLYYKEIDLFYKSIENKRLKRQLVDKGLSVMKKRQKTYFKDKYENLKVLDNFFLTMEGLGQYAMFLWLTHADGGNIKREIAIEGVRRDGKSWSQDEGFALFLILDKLTVPEKWVRAMYGDKTEGIIELIERFK